MSLSPRSESRIKEYDIKTTPDNISTRMLSARKQYSAQSSVKRETSAQNSVKSKSPAQNSVKSTHNSAGNTPGNQLVKSTDSFEIMSLSELAHTKPSGEFDYEKYLDPGQSRQNRQSSRNHSALEKTFELPPINQVDKAVESPKINQTDKPDDTMIYEGETKKVKQR